jgi:hypothetical protein
MTKGTADAVRRHIHNLVTDHNDSRATDRDLLEVGGVILPSDPVNKGDDWNQKSAAKIAGGNERMTVDTRATYRGPADRGGKGLDEIALSPAATLEPVAGPVGPFGPVTLKSQEGKGRLLFDNNRGRLVVTEVSQELDAESGAAGQNIVWKIKLSLSTRLLPSK